MTELQNDRQDKNNMPFDLGGIKTIYMYFDHAIIPSGLSLKQHIVALPTVQVFSKSTHWSFFDGYPKFDA